LGLQGGDPRGVAVSAVLPAEGHLPLMEGDEPVVGEGDAMGVAGEVGKDLLGPGKRWLAVHDPALGGGAREPVVRVVIAARGDRGASDGRLELGQELAAEDLGEDPNGQEEVCAGGDPVSVSRVEPAAGNDTVD